MHRIFIIFYSGEQSSAQFSFKDADLASIILHLSKMNIFDEKLLVAVRSNVLADALRSVH